VRVIIDARSQSGRRGRTVSAVDKTLSTLEYDYNGKIAWEVG
jgi:hypothetical protein